MPAAIRAILPKSALLVYEDVREQGNRITELEVERKQGNLGGIREKKKKKINRDQ